MSLFSVAYKEFLHVVRDWRILVLLITFPPAFTLILGHAFEVEDPTGVPTALRDEDQSDDSRRLVEFLHTDPTFALEEQAPNASRPELYPKFQAILTIPKGWGAGLNNGDPIPLQGLFNGADTTTAPQLEGAVQKALGDFQQKQKERLFSDVPSELIEVGEKIPVEFRHRITSLVEPWTLHSQEAYNPGLRFVNYVAPGIIGLVLQLLTVPLMAITLTRERESGTLSQLLLTTLRRWEIVVGKVLPHLLLSLLMVAVVIFLAHWHFGVHFPRLPLLATLCFLFLLCSLALGLVFSAFCNTQAQAIQLTVFFLLPTIPLSGAFAPLEQLPEGIKYLAEVFPLTHFCRAFRVVSLMEAPLRFLALDIAVLGLGALAMFALAALLLRRAE